VFALETEKFVAVSGTNNVESGGRDCSCWKPTGVWRLYVTVFFSIFSENKSFSDNQTYFGENVHNCFAGFYYVFHVLLKCSHFILKLSSFFYYEI